MHLDNGHYNIIRILCDMHFSTHLDVYEMACAFLYRSLTFLDRTIVSQTISSSVFEKHYPVFFLVFLNLAHSFL